jgi:hypothetical protein
MRSQFFLVVFSVSLISFSTADSLAQKPSTPEERARLVSIAQKLEANPLDPALKSEREWAIKWLIEVPDIHVGICPSILGDYRKYKYSSEITTQILLASAKFSIESPDQANDAAAQYIAGAESALKAYTAILQQDSKAKSKPLDDDLEKQSQGKLKDFLRDTAAKQCDKKS